MIDLTNADVFSLITSIHCYVIDNYKDLIVTLITSDRNLVLETPISVELVGDENIVTVYVFVDGYAFSETFITEFMLGEMIIIKIRESFDMDALKAELSSRSDECEIGVLEWEFYDEYKRIYASVKNDEHDKNELLKPLEEYLSYKETMYTESEKHSANDYLS